MTTGFAHGLTSYGDRGFSRYLRQAFLASAGYGEDDWDRPVVGIAHTISDYVTCHRQMPELVERVRRGVEAAGGIAMAFPVTPLARSSWHRRRCCCATWRRWKPRNSSAPSRWTRSSSSAAATRRYRPS
ncbi:dihydroxy-acid dehydratase [Phytohabitans flavus]|uniref:Dihydroxy-acid/6-phosphogluconate dehydratase N-terminal domain-containing protein n=1 Tax=Phytohabitans flavus TaxID=1076124 RepID=A0A6F8XLX9_9ACTN|nr:dihydroxy-acid dehydratase [Phytohabitans flavus]BCB74813.1 hypothetical protein Pflav_012230 [Phytohabitans flavus]